MSSFGSTRYDAQLHMVALLIDRIKSATKALAELEWDMTTPDLDTQRDHTEERQRHDEIT